MSMRFNILVVSARTYKCDNYQVVVCSEICCRGSSSIKPEHDSNRCDDHHDRNSGNQVTGSTFNEARYCGEAEISRDM